MAGSTQSVEPGGGDRRSVCVTVPAAPDAVQVVRAVVGSVASRLGFALEEVDDLRLAASEVVAHLLEESPPTPVLVVEVFENAGTIEVEASRTVAVEEWPPSGARHSLTTLILRALADDASFERTRHGPAIRFSKRHPSGVPAE